MRWIIGFGFFVTIAVTWWRVARAAMRDPNPGEEPSHQSDQSG